MQFRKGPNKNCHRWHSSVVVSKVPRIPEHETSSQMDMKSFFHSLKNREMEFM